jgi:DNA-binding NarL/FixJ family response regulator
MADRVKVLIVEDHRMLREGLKAILATRGDLEIIGEATDGLEALRAIKRVQPDIMLLDLSMPRMGGLSVLLEAKRYQPDIKILVLTIHQSEERIKEVFTAGADGFCNKNDSRQELLVAIDSVLAGSTYLSPSISKHVLTGYLAAKQDAGREDPWNDLSQREKEILKLLAEGYTNKQIGEMLFISAKTVEKHRSNIMAKLNLHSVANLTALAIEKGLVEKRAPSLRRGPAATSQKALDDPVY